VTVDEKSPSDDAKTPIDRVETPSSGKERMRPNGLAVIRRWTRRSLARWRPILVTALVVATVGLAAGLFFFEYRPDHHTDDAVAHQALQAASDGAVALLSYSPDHLDRDFAKAKSHLTGDFLAYYNKFSEQIVAPAAKQMHITTTAKVIRAAVSELQPDSAVVLVFVNQTAAGKDKPEPLMTPSSVRVTLTKVKGSWLIAKFDPL
jgi:Mce-associated membrane protein